MAFMKKNAAKVTSKNVNKVDSTLRNAGKKKLDNTADGAKSVPAVKKWKADKSTPKTFSTAQKMKKPTK
jgi:Asp/Glu/hydantoin racemase